MASASDLEKQREISCELLGLTSFASGIEVYTAKIPKDERSQAKAFKEDEALALREEKTLDASDQARIIKSKGFYSTTMCADPSTMTLESETTSGRSLADLIDTFQDLPCVVAKTYFLQILDVLEHLHTVVGVSHRNLNTENVWISSTFDLKLTNFSFVMTLPDECKLIDEVLNEKGYLAPEILMGEKYDPFQADIFALGVTLFVLVAGHRPFESADKEDLLYSLLISGKEQEYWEFHESFKAESAGFILEKGFFRQDFRDLITKMLAFKPEERLSKIKEIKSHPWCKLTVMKGSKIGELFGEIAKKRVLVI